MKLWIISQTVNNNYDTFDSAVVAAETEEEARNINPGGRWGVTFSTWANDPSEVTVEYLGVTDRDISGIVLASFNAG
jgi:hypothetical protein